MRLRSVLLSLFAVPLLAACVNDGATYEIDGTREHVLSLIREQPYFWDNKVNFFLVVSRMPACMRRHSLGVGTPNSKIEVYQVPSGAFIVKLGKKMFATETQTCESWARIEGEPEGGMGTLMGVFRVRKGEFVFVREDAGEGAGAEE